MNEIQATAIRLQIVADNDLIKKYNGLSDDIKLAVKALEKQIPKKIVHNPEAGREADWTCPACKRTCSPYARHCQNCGQALYEED